MLIVWCHIFIVIVKIYNTTIGQQNHRPFLSDKPSWPNNGKITPINYIDSAFEKLIVAGSTTRQVLINRIDSRFIRLHRGSMFSIIDTILFLSRNNF